MKYLKLISVSLLIALLFTITVFAKSAGITKLTTSNDADNSFVFEISGNKFSASGKIADAKYIYYVIGDNDKDYHKVELVEGAVVKLNIDLSKLSGRKTVKVFFSKDGKEADSVFADYEISIVKENGNWIFDIPESVYSVNKSMLSGFVDCEAAKKNEKDYALSDEIVNTVNTVISGCGTDTEKAFAIHRWIAKNLYLDVDFMDGRKTKTSSTLQDIYSLRITDETGFSKLEAAMMRCAGIPAILTGCYSRTADGKAWSDVSDILKKNSAFVEYYTDGVWHIAFPSLDSKNELYKDNKYTNVPTSFAHFDLTCEMLSCFANVISRANVYGKQGIDDWALEEVEEARKLGLVLPGILGSMKDDITRAEFCNLVMNMIKVKFGKSVEDILSEKGLAVDVMTFSDTDDFNILAANVLGIVNGVGDGKFSPDGLITRQDAATMLMRAATKVFGIKSSGKSSFKDSAEFGSWSVEGIDFCSTTPSKKTGKMIMGGIGEDKFGPRLNYTKEQSVLTIYRLFYA